MQGFLVSGTALCFGCAAADIGRGLHNNIVTRTAADDGDIIAKCLCLFIRCTLRGFFGAAFDAASVFIEFARDRLTTAVDGMLLCRFSFIVLK